MFIPAKLSFKRHFIAFHARLLIPTESDFEQKVEHSFSYFQKSSQNISHKTFTSRRGLRKPWGYKFRNIIQSVVRIESFAFGVRLWNCFSFKALKSLKSIKRHHRTFSLWMNTKQLRFTSFCAVTNTWATHCKNNFNYLSHPARDKCLKSNLICVVCCCESFVINFKDFNERETSFIEDTASWRPFALVINDSRCCYR